jgi:dihydrofolate reductase
MKLSIIAAMAANRVIGRDNRLPWNLPADLRRFRSLTLGHHLLMGRRTFESIGRPLPGRRSIVLTRQPGYSAPESVRVARSVGEAVALAEAAGDEEAFVAGGAQIYAETLAIAERLYLTLLGVSVAGDAWFPAYDEAAWRLVCRENRDADSDNGIPVSFLVYERATDLARTGPGTGPRDGSRASRG